MGLQISNQSVISPDVIEGIVDVSLVHDVIILLEGNIGPSRDGEGTNKNITI